MLKNKKIIAVLGLSAISVILVGTLAAMSQPVKETDEPNTAETTESNVIPNEIEETTPIPAITTTEIKPSEIPMPETTAESIQNNIPLTTTADKPEPPELPEVAYTGEQTGDATPDDVEAYEALDPELKNPDVKPTTTPAPVEPTAPKDETPKSGDKNDKGEMYIPGFGWVKDEGGGGHGEKSSSNGDWDKIIGY